MALRELGLLELQLQSTQAEQNVSLDQARFAYKRALEVYKEFEEKRKRTLEEILETRGLGVCSHDSHFISGNMENGAESLGIFPKNDLRMFYSSVEEWAGDDRMRKDPKLELLCLGHLPKPHNKVWPRELGSKYREDNLNIISEVVVKEGKIYTVVNDIEVNIEISINYNTELYRYFELPELPKFPEWK